MPAPARPSRARGAARPPEPPARSGEVRGWLLEDLQASLARGVQAWVLVGEPGMGKTAFLRGLAERWPGSPLVEIRLPLGTHRPSGFWPALLGQLDLDGSRAPTSPHEAARWAAQHLPPVEGGRRLVLVDALDRGPELLDASGLAGLDRPLPGVTLVVASRPGDHLECLAAAGARVLSLDPASPENRADLSAWLARSAGSGVSPDLLEAVAEEARGNLLVARLLLEACAQGVSGLHNLQENPPALEAALAALWSERLSLAPEEAREDMIAVACALSEAGESLPAAGLADFLQLSSSRVRAALARLRPILRYQDGHYGLFHPRMSGFLARRFRRDLVRVHEQVISFFREAYPSWEEMDDRYGWFHLGHHCDRFARTSRRRDFSVLHWLGEGPFIRAKLEHTGSLQAVLEDLSRCLRAALEERDLPRLVSYCLRIPRLRAREAAGGLRRLADRGDFPLAAERARLLRRQESRWLAMALLAWQAASEGDLGWTRRLVGEASGIGRHDLEEEATPFALWLIEQLAGCLEPQELSGLIVSGAGGGLRAVAWCLRLARASADRPQRARHLLELGAELAGSLSEASERDWASLNLARAFSTLGDRKRSRQLHRGSLEEAPVTLEGLGEAWEGFRRSRRPGAAFGSLLEALSAQVHPSRRVPALNALAVELGRRAGEGWVVEALGGLIRLAESLERPEERARAVTALAQSASCLPPGPEVRASIDLLEAMALALQPPQLRARALAKVAGARGAARQARRGLECLEAAVRATEEVQEREARGRLRILLAGVAAALGQPPRARDLAYDYLLGREAPGPARIDEEVRTALAVGVAASIPAERSLELFRSSAGSAREVTDLRLRAHLLATLADGLWRLGEEQEARTLFDQAVGAARASEPGAGQAAILAALAVQEGAWGDPDRADRLAREAEQAAQGETSQALRPSAGILVAQALVAMGHPAWGGRLFEEALQELEGAGEAAPPVPALGEAAALAARLGGEAEARVAGLLARARAWCLADTSPAGEGGLELLLRAALSLGDHAEARSLAAALKEPQARQRGRLLLARALIRSRPEEALDLLRRTRDLEERMRGVRECTLEIVREIPPSQRDRLLDTLAELTLLGIEDEVTADVLAGRWVNLIADRASVAETLRKIGYPPEDFLAGRPPELREL